MREIKLELADDAIRLSVRCWLPDTDPTRIVLLAHGYGEHSGRYRHVAERLTADGAVVYAPDHRGHGESAGEPALVVDVDALAHDLERVATAACQSHPGLPLAVVGHSMGGLVATRYAQIYPDIAALALSGPAIGGNPAIRALLDLDPLPEIPIDPSILSRDPAVGESYAADPLVWHGPFRRETLVGIFAGVDLVAEGAALDVPVLWMHGEEDALAPLEATRAAAHRSLGTQLTTRIYSGARHEIFHETNSKEVLDDLALFLAAST
ncbi:MAG: lysophospholipase [Sporichthyaceae bacterium]